MNFIKKNIYRILTMALLVAYCMHTSSCASTQGAPTGGPKDTIPPVVVKVVPEMNATGLPLTKSNVVISFNEYVQIKDASKNIFLSPPQKKPVKARVKGKGIVVEFQEPLDSNKTYSINFGGAIVDNNEGNPLNGFSYTFSTGDSVDSLMFSGKVVNSENLFPTANATVALYINPKDSSVITNLPAAIARTDEWGYFTVRNLKPIEYTIYAFSDENNNYMYDQGAESIAFIDTTITPVTVMDEDLPQLQYIDPKDTTALLARPSEIELALFKEKSNNQFIRDYKRYSNRGAYIKFNSADVQIDSFSIAGIKDSQILKQFNVYKDSLSFWINEPGKLNDTLLLGIKYHKTDTAGVLTPTVEKLKLIAPFEKKNDKKGNSENKADNKRKDLLEFKITADNKKVEQNGIELSFNEPLVKVDIDSIRFTMTNAKQIVSDVEFSLKQDSLEMNKYIIRPNIQFVRGNDYTIIFPQGIFRDINGFTNDSTQTKITLPNSDNMSSITFEITNVNARYIVELINEKRNTVFRKYIITEDSKLPFPYLDKGTYSLRITEDKNNNGLLDTGDLMAKRQPEKVLLYKLGDGKDIITLNEKTDLVQTVDIEQMFGK